MSRAPASPAPTSPAAPAGHAVGHPAAPPGIAPVLGAVTTMLTPDERMRVDAAGMGLYHAMHRETLEDVIRDVRERGAAAVVMSVACCSARELPRLARMVREFPRVPAVALLTDVGSATPHTVLGLGRSGVRALIDVRQPTGWRALRTTLLNERAEAIERRAVAQVMEDIAGAPPDCRRLFEVLFTGDARSYTVRGLADALGVGASTLLSRFFRARLPAPKRYLANARLVRAARLLENAGLSIANVANQLEYSSPQSFGRHVKGMLGLTAQRFRETYDGEGMLHRFRAELVLPHVERLRGFRPGGRCS
jgi:AraC-like DNA-binding protein